MEQLRVSHDQAISSLNEQYQSQIELLRKTHGEELNLNQQKLDQLLVNKSCSFSSLIRFLFISCSTKNLNLNLVVPSYRKKSMGS